ncbi:MAG: BrnT family toxin [Candidatus Microgenomates bacterium]|jgi:hypothetical protein
MQIKREVIEFEWDRENLDKSYLKHGITTKEAEEVFISEESYVITDVKYSQKEERFIILGKSQSKRNLFVVFTMRGKKIRIISARRMHREEVEKYEKAKKNS